MISAAYVAHDRDFSVYFATTVLLFVWVLPARDRPAFPPALSSRRAWPLPYVANMLENAVPRFANV